MTERILKKLMNLSERISLEPVWDFLPRLTSVRRLRENCETVFAVLREEFEDDVLVTARIAQRTDSGDIIRTPAMSIDDPTYLFLSHKKAKTLFELVGLFGSLMHEDPPCFHAGNDAHTDAKLRKRHLPDALFLAFDMQDVAILRALGLPVSVAAGLSDLKQNQVFALGGGVYDQKNDDVVMPTSVERAPIASYGRKLVLIGWSPSRLEVVEPDGLRAVVSNLNDLQYAFGFDFNVEVWRPDSSELQDIQVAVKTEHPGLIRVAMFRSVEYSSYDLDDYTTEFGGDSAGSSAYMNAKQQLSELLSPGRSVTPEQMDRARKKFDEAFEQIVTDPMIRAAEQTRDPVKCSLFLIASELSRRTHDQSTIVARSSAENFHASARVEPVGPSGISSEYLAAVDRIIRIQGVLNPKK